MKNIILNKCQMIRINYLTKQRVFELMGVSDLKDKLAVVNAYFTTKTLPQGLPANAR